MRTIFLNNENIRTSSIKLDNAFDEFLKYCKSQNLSTDTVITYEKNYKYFCEFLDLHRDTVPITLCNQVNEKVMIDYVIFMKDKKAIKDVTINTRIRHIKVFFMFCFKHSYMQFFEIKKIRQQKEIKELYTEYELEQLLRKPDTSKCTFEEYRNWVAVNVLYATGFRLQTLASIEIKDVDTYSKKIYIRQQKNKKAVWFPIGEFLKDVLTEYLSFRKRTAKRKVVLQC